MLKFILITNIYKNKLLIRISYCTLLHFVQQFGHVILDFFDMSSILQTLIDICLFHSHSFSSNPQI
jgi:hypothetical protein